MARLRQDEMREMVRSYFAASLDRYVERLNDTGLPDRSIEALRQELPRLIGLTGARWAENEPSLRQEMRKARRDQIRAILSVAESLEGYSFTENTRPDSAKATTGSLREPQRRHI